MPYSPGQGRPSASNGTYRRLILTSIQIDEYISRFVTCHVYEKLSYSIQPIHIGRSFL